MKEKTNTWLELAEDDLELARSILHHNNRPHYSVHFCHQAIEKILKAIVQEHTEEDPRRTHSFKSLCEQGHIVAPVSVEDLLKKLSPHYLASRYPDDLQRFYRQYTPEFGRGIMKETGEAFKWLKDYLISKK